MLTFREIKSKQIPYFELDDETKEYVYDTFKRYVVRKKIADANKELTTLFVRKCGPNPREYARCFNDFNSCFVNANLIGYLNYDEIHTTYLRDMTEDRFNAYLSETGNSFDRKIALMCFSMRPSERIANRVEFPVMVAYANMQALVLAMAKENPKMPLSMIFKDAAKLVRTDFYTSQGRKINNSKIAQKREDYKALGKKAAPVWKDMIDFYINHLQDLDALEAAAFVKQNFVFTKDEMVEFDRLIQYATDKAHKKIVDERAEAERRMEEESDTYIPADYDEVFSRAYAEEIYSDELDAPLKSILVKYLEDPIFTPKEKDQKNKGEE